MPDEIEKEVKKLKNVNEIRLRVNANPQIYTSLGVIFLNKVTVTSKMLENIVLLACKRSVYGYDEYIKRGFITTEYGERIGLAGEIVYVDGIVSTIKNYSSLCVRIPNDVKNVSLSLLKIFKGGSVLVVSKSGVGKTTYLRDLVRQISNKFNENVVVVDERNEIAVKSNNSAFYLGNTVDVLTFSSKNYGFTHDVRTRNPTYLVCDELVSSEDISAVITAVKSGVNVIASMHGNDNFKDKITNFIDNNTFNYYVYIDKILNNRIYKIYDNCLNFIC
ncbi:MAG: hypothetical protein J6R88_05955 [Clostridia bacterium]|nr:hypothetical protein [Clostridia bacterium]